nr:EOG090X03TW [Moina brachiata]
MAEALGESKKYPRNGVHLTDASTNSILDSRDPFENPKASCSIEKKHDENNDVSVTKPDTQVESVQNGDAGLLEIAVEAGPDLVFESDLVSNSQLQLPSNVRPRVYLERESFNSPSNETQIQSTLEISKLEETRSSPIDENNGSDSTVWKGQRKHFFVLSEAGKPIYTRHGNEEQLVTLFGVMQALVSVIEDGQDAIETIISGDAKFVFLHKPPLILVAVSKIKDSIIQLQLQLEYIFNQIVSVITKAQLDRIFEQRRNYDLRRLLGGSERLLDNLGIYMDSDYSVLLGAVKCLPMLSSDRDSVTQTIHQQSSKVKSLLFAILVGNNQLITLVRISKKHLLHPSDVHFIINLVNSSETFKTAEGWSPICLPHLDSSNFLYVHASYLSEDCPACLLFFSTDRDSFFALSDAKKNIVDRLRRHNNILESIAVALNASTNILSQLGSSEIRHFLYKSRTSAQFTSSNLPPIYQSDQGQQYLMDLYRHVHGRIHSSSRPLKLLCHTSEKEIMFAWVTPSFELYMVLEPMTTKPAVMAAANAVIKWIKREEETYFITTSGSW